MYRVICGEIIPMINDGLKRIGNRFLRVLHIVLQNSQSNTKHLFIVRAINVFKLIRFGGIVKGHQKKQQRIDHLLPYIS